MKICFVLPTRNEEKTIENIILSIKSEVQSLGHDLQKIIVTDDSSDSTRAIVKKNGGEVIIGGGKGLGHAMFRGLKRACIYSPDVIVSMDSDGQSDIKELSKFLLPIIEKKADMVLGSRFLEKDLVKYKYQFINRLGIKVLVTIINKLSKLSLTDSHGGLRAVLPEVIEHLEMIGTHTYVQETIIDACEKGFKVIEIPSEWKERSHGSSRVVFSI